LPARYWLTVSVIVLEGTPHAVAEMFVVPALEIAVITPVVAPMVATEAFDVCQTTWVVMSAPFESFAV